MDFVLDLAHGGVVGLGKCINSQHNYPVIKVFFVSLA